jgi:WD40 repeat protein
MNSSRIQSRVCSLSFFNLGGKIRVINQHTGARCLLKQHSDVVVDMSYNGGLPLLASASKDGSLFIWEFSVAVLEGGRDIAFSTRLEIKIESGQTFSKVFWHPNSASERLFAATTENEVYEIDLKALRSHNTETIVGDYSLLSKTSGITLAAHQTNSIQDIFISESTLAVSTDDGQVKLWNHGADSCSSTIVVDNNSISTIFLVSDDKDYLITCSLNNTIIELWDIERKVCLHKLSFSLDEVRKRIGFNRRKIRKCSM